MKLCEATALFQINLPVKRNDGGSYADAIEAFEGEALRLLGGFTRLANAKGAWYSAETGKVYWDECAVYQFACTPRQFSDLGESAGILFPDQECIFMAHIGNASIVAPIDSLHHWDMAVAAVSGDTAPPKGE